MGDTGTVTVTSPAKRKVYINGNYAPDFPQIIKYTFEVDYGENVFETLDANGRVDYRGTVVTDNDNPDRDLALKRVVPPQAVG